MMLAILNVFFFVFHSALIAFNMFGWAWRRTRAWNLLTLGLTAGSWFVMGIWYGIGFCVCTEWHMQVRRAMGIHDPESSYVQLLFSHVLGAHIPTSQVNLLCGVVFGVAVVLSVILNIRDWRRKPSAERNSPP
jgi:hypothetical protein